MEFSILSRFGLNKNDILVYEQLLKIGRSKTGAIIKATGISSSSIYASLAFLTSRGLVSYQVKNNIKYYQAELPSQLIDDTRQQTYALEKLSKAMTTLPIQHTERNEINVYEGIAGFKRAHEIMAKEIKRGEEVNVISYSTYYGKTKPVRKFFTSLDKKLLTEIKCNIKMITDRKLKESIISDRKSFVKKYQFRCLPTEYFNLCGINITDSMVLMTVWGKKPIVFMLRNKAIIDSFRANFNFVWEMARK